MKIPNVFFLCFNRNLVSLLVCLFIVIANVASVMPQKNFAARNVTQTLEIYNNPSLKIRETKDSKNRAKTERNKAFTPQTSNPQKAELVVQTGHSSSINSVAFSPDGKTLASGGGDKTIKLWDVMSGKELRTLSGHSLGVNSVTFSPDGKFLASGSNDKTIKLWDVMSGKELRTISGHSSNVTSVTFSPNGKTIASGDWDNTIKLWEVESGKELRTLLGHFAWVSSVTFSPDGSILASGSNDKTIKLWDVESGKELRTLIGRSNRVSSVAFSSDGKTLVYGDGETIKLWEVESGKELRTLIGHSHYVESVVFSPDGSILASGSNDKTIKLWDVMSGKELRTLTGHSYRVSSVTFSPDGKILASGSNDNTIKLWEVETGKELRTVSRGSNSVLSIAFSSDGKTLACGSSNKTIKLWDVANGKELRTLSGHSNRVVSVAFSPDGKILASGSWDNTIKLWDVESGRLLESLDENEPDTKQKISKLFDLKIMPELFPKRVDSERFIAIVVENVKLKLFDHATGKEFITLIAFDKDDWIVVDPEGRFDASKGAQKFMHYVVGLEPIDLEQIKDRYYQPRLLEKILKGEPLRTVTPFTGDELYPLVKYEPPKQGQKNFTIGLKNRGGGIGAVQVFINGKEFIGDARPKNFDSKQKEATITVDLSNAPFIAGKENLVKVYARNSAGWLRSRGSESLYVAEGKEVQEIPHLYAIIGGVSDYAEDKLDLRYSSKDAEDFARAVEMGASKLLGKERVHIRLLTNGTQQKDAILSVEDSKRLAPTKENFKKSFEEFKKAKPTDIFIIYLSGHGTSINKGGDTGDTYLYLTQDATTTDSTRLVDEKLRDATTISSDELVAWIKEVPALKQAMVLDTCAAGAAETSLFAKRDLPTDQIRAIDRLKDRTGFFVLMGSAANAQAYEATRYGQGLLTYALLQGMQGAKLKDSEYADVSLLFNYASDLVPDMAKGIGGIQQPRIIAPTESRSFDIGRFTTEEKSRFTLARIKPLILRPALQNDKLKFDNLRLTPLLIKALRDASYTTTRGRDESPLVFVDADEMYDAITPSGVYEINGDTLKLTIILVKNNNAVKTLTVEGNINDKDSLISGLVKTVTEAAQEIQTTRKP